MAEHGGARNPERLLQVLGGELLGPDMALDLVDQVIERSRRAVDYVLEQAARGIVAQRQLVLFEMARAQTQEALRRVDPQFAVARDGDLALRRHGQPEGAR